MRKPDHRHDEQTIPRRDFYYLTDDEVRKALTEYLRSQGVVIEHEGMISWSYKERGNTWTFEDCRPSITVTVSPK